MDLYPCYVIAIVMMSRKLLMLAISSETQTAFGAFYDDGGNQTVRANASAHHDFGHSSHWTKFWEILTENDGGRKDCHFARVSFLCGVHSDICLLQYPLPHTHQPLARYNLNLVFRFHSGKNGGLSGLYFSPSLAA